MSMLTDVCERADGCQTALLCSDHEVFLYIESNHRSVLFPQEGQPHPLAVGRTVPVVQGPAPGAQDRPPQDEPEVPVLSVHRHQGAGAELAGPGTRRAQGL